MWTREAGDGNGRGMVLGWALTGCGTLAGYLALPGLPGLPFTLGAISCSSATLSGYGTQWTRPSPSPVPPPLLLLWLVSVYQTHPRPRWADTFLCLSCPPPSSLTF